MGKACLFELHQFLCSFIKLEYMKNEVNIFEAII